MRACDWPWRSDTEQGARSREQKDLSVLLRAACSEQWLIHLGRQRRRLLPSELPRSGPSLLHQLLPLIRIIQSLQRVYIVAGIASLDHHGRARRDFFQRARSRRDDRQSRRKRLEHREAKAFI